MTTPIRVENRDTIPSGFIDSNEAAKRLGLSASSLRVYRSKGLGPRWIVVGGWRTAYAVADVEDYLRRQAAVMQRDADKAQARADAMLARIAETGATS
jgi:predicted DNA-binding transcriptional regulator AlpA